MLVSLGTLLINHTRVGKYRYVNDQLYTCWEVLARQQSVMQLLVSFGTLRINYTRVGKSWYVNNHLFTSW